MNAIQFHLKKLGARGSALKWAHTQDNPNDAWKACPRGDWLLGLANRLGVEHRVVVLAACACARLALPFSRDERLRHAIVLTERFVAGDADVTAQQMKDAAKDCDDAALDAGCRADQPGAHAAYAAMYATIAALPGNTPKGAAADAAMAVAEAAAEAAATHAEERAARIIMRRGCARTVRSKIDEAVIMNLWWKHVTRSRREDQPCTL